MKGKMNAKIFPRDVLLKNTLLKNSRTDYTFRWISETDYTFSQISGTEYVFQVKHPPRPITVKKLSPAPPRRSYIQVPPGGHSNIGMTGRGRRFKIWKTRTRSPVDNIPGTRCPQVEYTPRTRSHMGELHQICTIVPSATCNFENFQFKLKTKLLVFLKCQNINIFKISECPHISTMHYRGTALVFCMRLWVHFTR